MKKIKDFKIAIKNILLIRRNNIGDMIGVIPVFRSVRKEFPQAHITVLADSTNAGIIRGASFIDDILIYEKGSGIYRSKYLNYWRLFQKNKRKFDLAIGLKRGFSSTMAAIIALSRAGIRAGCVPEKWHPLQHCYNLPIEGCSKWGAVSHIDAFLELIKTIGIENTVKDISIEITPDSKAKVRGFLEGIKVPAGKNKVIFNISNNKPENTWQQGRFIELGNMLYKKYGAVIIITSTGPDMDKALALCKQMDGAAFYFQTPKVMDFAALAAQSNLLICGEGGAMHIGSAVGVPTISLWGSQRPRKWMPYGEKQYVIMKNEHVNSISAEDVYGAVRENNIL
ncbi:MAG: glycosyltransferase family 9 protein [Nitrospirae bacterium]|nr:glycosyltransferase family 9 protein [Nitrospirota bacterium]